MKLDFTALQSIAPQEPQDRPQTAGTRLPGISTLQDEKPATGGAARPAGTLCEGIEILQEADRLKQEIKADLTARKDPLDILLKAVDCIGVLSQDAGIYNQCRELMRSGYGYGLRETLQTIRAGIADTEKALRRDDLTPAKGRILQRLLNTYREKADKLQREIDALQAERPADPAEEWTPWDELPAPEREKLLREWERHPDSIHGVIKNLRFTRDEIKTAGRVLRHIKDQLDEIDARKGWRSSWNNTSQTEILELLERKGRKY